MNYRKVSQVLAEEGLLKTAQDPHAKRNIQKLLDATSNIDMLPRTRDLSPGTVKKINILSRAVFEAVEAISADLGVDVDY